MMNTESFKNACINAGFGVYSIGPTTFAKKGVGKPIAQYTEGDTYAIAKGHAFTNPAALEATLKNI